MNEHEGSRYVKTRMIMSAGVLLVAATLLPVSAASAQATPDAQACAVTDGTLSWGVKESFRSYISGTIANGSWDTSDGATYETPEFAWTGATGSFDPASGTGSVSFAGSVHFTGHDGVLDLTLGSPTIEFEGDTAALLLDARSADMEGEVAVDAQQERVGDVTLSEAPQPDGDVLSASDLPTALTDPGASAFAGFYEAGEALDDLSFSVTLEDCDASAPTEPAPGAAPISGEPAAVQPLEVRADIPWAAIGVGGVALLAIGFTGGLLVGGRRQRPHRQGESADGAQWR